MDFTQGYDLMDYCNGFEASNAVGSWTQKQNNYVSFSHLKKPVQFGLNIIRKNYHN